ncbi:MAG: methyl-accepting chemotaxis protein [Humidesulfovibrio sp.]|uniref:methyl-accepting chemotaxis protein n=1 Tax=Humidesulfovibrio sp. TaxID=2910988 RepID=UPI0027FCFC2A|nr:methyl-accepting chemotaxis protein [Humidesulfovibrio sp.]MDQ7835987.1 methyl-accepting chemotaxis protein [Humidesulfovibrio sp.]
MSLNFLNIVARAKISAKIWIISAVTIALFVVATLYGFLPLMAEKLMEEKRVMLANLVRVEDAQVRDYQARAAKGEFTVEEAKAKALEFIAKHRYGPEGKDYFWVNSNEATPVMVMHPTVPALNGKPIVDPKFATATSMRYRGADGKWVVTEIPGGKGNLFQAMVGVTSKSPDGIGYVTYNWPKPKAGGGVTAEMFPKESCVKLDKDWGWVIGTGIYVDDVEAEVAGVRLLVLGVVGVVAVAAALLTLFILLGITRPLGRLVDYSLKVAEGKLDANIEGSYHAELGELKDSLTLMVAHLKKEIAIAKEHETLAAEKTCESEKALLALQCAEDQAKEQTKQTVSEIIAKLRGSSEEVLSSVMSAMMEIEDIHNESEQQLGHISEVATAMDEMTATVLEVAKSAGRAAEGAENTRKSAENGARVVESSVKAINTVHDLTVQLKTNMVELHTQAEGIGQIMGVISDIADQTNLLALNAAIEAARAGDAGRGFAVVADEVRKLAEKTMNATKEVAQAVNAIQGAAKLNMDGTDAAAQAVEQATTFANESGDALKSIVHLVGGTSDQVRSIATASEEQSAASEEIDRIVSQVRNASQVALDNTATAANAVAKTSSAARALQDEIEDLKKMYE